MKIKSMLCQESLLLMLLIGYICPAQTVIVKLYSPPPNQWNIEDLWNLTLTNMTSEQLDVYLDGSVTEGKKGLILQGKSAVFQLSPNFSGRIDPSILEPADIDYADKEYQEGIWATGSLPAGEYTICLNVIDFKSGETLGKDCILQPISSLSPPELISPRTGDNITSDFPVFSWIPPTPLTTENETTYRIRIVELLDSQSPEEAIESNPAWLSEEGIISASYQYPMSARPMLPGRYAWQVTAYSGKNEIGKSEVWGFTTGKAIQVQVDSLVIILSDNASGRSYDWDNGYDWTIYVTNPNPSGIYLSVTEIVKTSPNCKSPVLAPDEKLLEIKSGSQGVMTGKIYTGKTLVKKFQIRADFSDESDPSIILANATINGTVLVRKPRVDFGDAPDENNNTDFHYCTHLLSPPAGCTSNVPRISPSPWTGYEAAIHENFRHEWLGDTNTASCSTIPQADGECNGKTINQEPEDDGIIFTNLFHSPFQACDTQRVQVKVSVLNAADYNDNAWLHLNAWFDWGQDGNWDGIYPCGSGHGDDHVFWLKGRPISPPGNEFTINDYDFKFMPLYPARWPDQSSTCQVYELTFLSGEPAGANKVTDTLWTRFRLSYGPYIFTGSYHGREKRGEVEDYPAPAATAQACGSFTDPRDGKPYNAVQIGSQCWMAQNLDYSASGTFIPTYQPQTNNGGSNVIEKYCFNNQQVNCDDYGGLYTWAEALTYVNGAGNTNNNPIPPGNIQGVCPPGWHIPSDAEWCILEQFLEAGINCNIQADNRGLSIGAMLKEPGTAHWNTNTGTTNSSGFTALGGGVVDVAGNSMELKNHGHWWATDPFNATEASFRHLFSSNNYIGRGGSGNAKTNAHSIRCIKD